MGVIEHSIWFLVCCHWLSQWHMRIIRTQQELWRSWSHLVWQKGHWHVRCEDAPTLAIRWLVYAVWPRVDCVMHQKVISYIHCYASCFRKWKKSWWKHACVPHSQLTHPCASLQTIFCSNRHCNMSCFVSRTHCTDSRMLLFEYLCMLFMYPAASVLFLPWPLALQRNGERHMGCHWALGNNIWRLQAVSLCWLCKLLMILIWSS